MTTKPIQPVIYVSLAVLLGCVFSFGMKVSAKTSLPCPDGYWDASIGFCTNRDYMYGYGIYADDVDDNGYGYGETSEDTTDTSTYPAPTTPETTTPETTPTEIPTDTGAVVVPPAETTDTTTTCQITKPRHLRAKHKTSEPKIVLRWTSKVSNCVSGVAVHYTVRIQSKHGKTVLVARQIESAKYVLLEKRLKAHTKYTFSVRAIASDGTKTSWSKAKRLL